MELVRYDAAKSAIAELDRIDEAKDWSDKAMALRAYAMQADDPELETMARRIRARATRRMGEISRNLEKIGGPGRGKEFPPLGSLLSKAAVLKEAGISTSVAHRAEQVAAIPAAEFEARVEAAHPPSISTLAKPHVLHNSGENEWYTPAAIIEAARACMGAIDLDPASSAKAQETVKATRFYDIDDDGLSQPWAGRVWLNPPYERGLVDRFVTRLLSEPTVQACVIVNNATETAWGQLLLGAAAAVCFPAGRVRYLSHDGPKNTPLQGQMLCGISTDVDAFRAAFTPFGVVRT